MKNTLSLTLRMIALSLLLQSTAPAQVPQLLNYQGRVSVNGTNFTGVGQFKFALVNNGAAISGTASATAVISFGFLVNANITAAGAGYSNAPTVTVIGGGGTGAQLVAQISNSGVVTNVVVLNPGSGYTTVPSIQFSAPPLAFASLWSNDSTSINGSQPSGACSLGVTNGLYSVLLGDTTVGNMAALTATIFTNSSVQLRVWFNNGVNGFQQLSPDQRIAAVGYALVASTVPDGSITASKIAPGSVGASQLAPGLSGLLNFQVSSGTNIQAAVNSSYLTTNTGRYVVTLPANPSVGDRVRVTGGSGGLELIANTGQSIINPPTFKWQKLNVGFGPINSIASSADGSKLVAAAGDIMSDSYIYTSTNYGVNWSQQTNDGYPRWSSVASSADGSKLVGVSGSLYTSTNYGVNWIQQTNAGYFSAVASSADGSKLVAGSPVSPFYGDSYIYTSTNYGVNWTQQTNTILGTVTGVASSADGSRLVACNGSYNLGYINTSTNYGVNWTRQTNAGLGYWNSVSSSADGKKLVAVNGKYGLGYMYTSTNYGVNWAEQPHAGSGDWISVASSADGNKLIALQTHNSGGYIYSSPSYLTQWSTVYVFGEAYASMELIYVGNNLWSPSFSTGSFYGL